MNLRVASPLSQTTNRSPAGPNASRTNCVAGPAGEPADGDEWMLWIPRARREEPEAVERPARAGDHDGIGPGRAGARLLADVQLERGAVRGAGAVEVGGEYGGIRRARAVERDRRELR